MKLIILVLILSISFLAMAQEEQTQLEQLECSASHMEASRLHDHVMAERRGRLAEEIRQAHEGESISTRVEREVNLSDFNLDLLAIENIKFDITINNDYRDNYGQIGFVVRRGPQMMAIRDSVNAGILEGSATESTGYAPEFGFSRKAFVNLVVYDHCKRNSPYFMSRVYIRDDNRDDSSERIYPRGGLGQVAGFIGRLFSE